MLCAKAALCAIRLTGPTLRSGRPRRRPGLRCAFWNAAQLQIFLGTVEQERLGRALVLSAHTGMRRGEVMGLRWSDVDLEARLIHVRQSATVVAYELRIADVKTSYGRRTIDVNGDVVDALRGWRRMQLEERLLVGNAYEDHDLVFARADGQPTHPELLSRAFERVVGRAAYRSSGCTTFGTRTPRCC